MTPHECQVQPPATATKPYTSNYVNANQSAREWFLRDKAIRSYQGVCRAVDGEWMEFFALMLGCDDPLLGIRLTSLVFSLLIISFPLHHFTAPSVVTLDFTVLSVSTI